MRLDPLTGQLLPSSPSSGSGSLPLVSRRVVLLGDSISDICGGPRLDGTIQSYFPNGYWTWASIFLRHQFQLVINAGISGDNTANMDARFAADVAAHLPDVVVVLAGINDVFGVTPENKETVLAGLETHLASIYDKALAVGAFVLAIPTLPVSAFFNGSGLSASQKEVQSKLNHWIRSQALSRQNVLLADGGLLFADPETNYEPLYANNGFPDYQVDGLHPGATAALVIGRAVAEALEPLARSASLLPPGNGSAANLISNASLSGASGTDTAPTGWTGGKLSGSGSATFSYAARNDGRIGNFLIVTNSDTETISYLTIAVSSGFAVGDTLIASIEYAADGGTAIPLIVETRMPNASTIELLADAGRAGMLNGGVDRIVDASIGIRSGVLQTPPITVTADTGFINVTVYMMGVGTYKLARASLVKV